MTTQVAASRALDHWRRLEKVTQYDALCSIRGGTLIGTANAMRCVRCDGS